MIYVATPFTCSDFMHSKPTFTDGPFYKIEIILKNTEKKFPTIHFFAYVLVIYFFVPHKNEEALFQGAVPVRTREQHAIKMYWIPF